MSEANEVKDVVSVRPDWITDRKPEDEDEMCVIYVRNKDCSGDYFFGWWIIGAGSWDTVDVGWVDDKDVLGWHYLPLEPAH